MHQPHRDSECSCTPEKNLLMAPRKITSSLHRVSGLSGWVTHATVVVLFSSRRAAERLGSSDTRHTIFLLVALPALKDHFQTAVFHSNASRGGKDFSQKIRDALSDEARSAAPILNMLDCSKPTNTSKPTPMDGESSRAGQGHSKYGFRAKRSSSTYSYTDGPLCGKRPYLDCISQTHSPNENNLPPPLTYPICSLSKTSSGRCRS